ncbi:MAG TPA: hypothetical protein VHL98_07245 [Microvirga sp.]|jgi:hypothetical protein|nr:hypothetical protein [Microvirga sp.]
MRLDERGFGRIDDPLSENENAFPIDDHGIFVYVPLGWRTDSRPATAEDLSRLYVEDALQELHARYASLPVPDRILDLVGRSRPQA